MVCADPHAWMTSSPLQASQMLSYTEFRVRHYSLGWPLKPFEKHWCVGSLIKALHERSGVALCKGLPHAWMTSSPLQASQMLSYTEFRVRHYSLGWPLKPFEKHWCVGSLIKALRKKRKIRGLPSSTTIVTVINRFESPALFEF